MGKIFRTTGDEVDIVTQLTELGIADILVLPIGWDWGKSKRQSALLHQAVCEGNASVAACGLPVLSPLRSASAPMTSSTATFFLFACRRLLKATVRPMKRAPWCGLVIRGLRASNSGGRAFRIAPPKAPTFKVVSYGDIFSRR